MTGSMNDDQLEFDLGGNEKPATITVNEEQASTGAGEQQAASEQDRPEQQSHADELSSVNDAVQKRIAMITAKRREAERREQAALEYAKGLQVQAQTLQQHLVHTDYSRLNETRTRLETQQAALKQIIQKAREEGDVSTEIEAQERLTGLLQEKTQVSQWLQHQEVARQQAAYQQAQPVRQQPVRQQPPAPDPRAEEWAARNEWFGQDRMMTYAAWGIHQNLIEQEGIDPNSDEYYTELDRRIREEFPKRFANASRQQRYAPAVAPASRSSGINSARRTVRLSPSQVAIAKKLGVPLEEYAKHVKE